MIAHRLPRDLGTHEWIMTGGMNGKGDLIIPPKVPVGGMRFSVRKSLSPLGVELGGARALRVYM